MRGKEDGRGEGVTRSRVDDPRGRKTPHGGFLNNFRAPRPVGSGYGDLPSHFRHPLSLGRPNIKECGPM
jgi:hypothetical protein